jgi:F-type H+-transporting ATPase subunit gamma
VSDTTANLRRKIVSAAGLRSVVRTMKAVATSNIVEYEKAVYALTDYFHTVILGLGVCFREREQVPVITERKRQTIPGAIGAVVFGSDQGLVGRFNDDVVDFTIKTLADLPVKPDVWSVGEHVHARLMDAGLPPIECFPVPVTINAISPLVAHILLESETRYSSGEIIELHLFYNRPASGAAYVPFSQLLLPLDEIHRREPAGLPWPRGNVPEIIDGCNAALPPLIREYLFVSLFRAFAQSLASENSSRLAAMHRADKNIGELLEHLNGTFHRLRQNGIDEELFDVISGFEALNVKEK